MCREEPLVFSVSRESTCCWSTWRSTASSVVRLRCPFKRRWIRRRNNTLAMERKRPEDFLELLDRAKRGRLKVFIGSAAGVGKTYPMLEEAHALKKHGDDILLAFIETHGRAETDALIEGLEVIPRQRIEHSGEMAEEMDLAPV